MTEPDFPSEALAFTTPEEKEFADWMITIFAVHEVSKEVRREFMERFLKFKEATRDHAIEECAVVLEDLREFYEANADDHKHDEGNAKHHIHRAALAYKDAAWCLRALKSE